jgi:hypothetical protein
LVLTINKLLTRDEVKGLAVDKICFLNSFVPGRLAMKLLELRINTHTIRGNKTILECRYDLEGETLYAVKWYKDGNEFYRYLPRETPNIQVFDLPGINVDVSIASASMTNST